jgi:NADPH:quinone reductase-like Zn-dependent oxidoreductase
MKAILIRENGGIDKFILTDIPQPEIGENEVLVKVNAISINPVDTAVRQNRQVMMKILKIIGEHDYYIPGWDISGKVVKTGQNAASLEGKDVFGMVNFPGYGKAYAEFVAAPVNHMALKPQDISHEEAAGATLAALTAWQALVTHGKIVKGEKVLIHAAAGGVGHFAVQIAKYLGAYVIGTGSEHNMDFVLGMGADQFIDYNKQQFEMEVNDADMVLDSINNRDNLSRSLMACRQGGRLISIKYYFDEELKARASEKQLYTDRILVSSNGADMKKIAVLLEKGIIKTHISAIYPFSSLGDAHKQVETGRTRGKVIVRL